MLGMRNIKTSLLKIKWNKHTTLLSDANVPVHFRAQQRAKCSSQQLTANCIAAQQKASPTLFQTDLRITDHRGHKFQPSLTLFSVKNSNRVATRLTAFASLPSVIFNPCNIQGNIQAFWLTGLLWWQKLTRIFQHFLLRIVNFAVQFFLRDTGVKLDTEWRDFPGPITILCYA